MSTETSSNAQPRFPLLIIGNYSSWSGNARAWFMRQGLWGIVSGRTLKPVPVDEKTVTTQEAAAIQSWAEKAERAAGELYLLVSPSQKVHFQGISDDPCAMWKKLESVHLQKCSGARFNAYDALFGIKKASDESLSALMARVDSQIEQIQNLRPVGFTLEDMDKELVCMTLIRALPRNTLPLPRLFSLWISLRKRSCRKHSLPKNNSGIAPTAWTLRFPPLPPQHSLLPPPTRPLSLLHLPHLLFPPLTSHATSAPFLVTSSPPAIASRLHSYKRLRQLRKRPRNAGEVVQKVLTALNSLQTPRRRLQLLLLLHK